MQDILRDKKNPKRYCPADSTGNHSAHQKAFIMYNNTQKHSLDETVQTSASAECRAVEHAAEKD